MPNVQTTKIAIISNKDFQPLHMVKNYISYLQIVSRPFNFYDPDYDEHITFLTGLNTILDAVAVVQAGIEGFEVDSTFLENPELTLLERNKIMVAAADRIVIFWEGKDDAIKAAIDYSIELNKNLEIFYPPKEAKK